MGFSPADVLRFIGQNGLPLPGFQEGFRQAQADQFQRARQQQADAQNAAIFNQQQDEYKRARAERDRLNAPFSQADADLWKAISTHSLTPEQMTGYDSVALQRATNYGQYMPVDPYAPAPKPVVQGGDVTLPHVPVGNLRPKMDVGGELRSHWNNLLLPANVTPAPTPAVQHTPTPHAAQTFAPGYEWYGDAMKSNDVWVRDTMLPKANKLLGEFVVPQNGKGWNIGGITLTHPITGQPLVPNPSLPPAQQNQLARDLYHTLTAGKTYFTPKDIGKSPSAPLPASPGQVEPFRPNAATAPTAPAGAMPSGALPIPQEMALRGMEKPRIVDGMTQEELTAARNEYGETLWKRGVQPSLIEQKIKEKFPDSRMEPQLLVDGHLVPWSAASQFANIGAFDEKLFSRGEGQPFMSVSDNKTMATLPYDLTKDSLDIATKQFDLDKGKAMLPLDTKYKQSQIALNNYLLGVERPTRLKMAETLLPWQVQNYQSLITDRAENGANGKKVGKPNATRQALIYFGQGTTNDLGSIKIGKQKKSTKDVLGKATEKTVDLTLEDWFNNTFFSHGVDLTNKTDRTLLKNVRGLAKKTANEVTSEVASGSLDESMVVPAFQQRLVAKVKAAIASQNWQ